MASTIFFKDAIELLQEMIGYNFQDSETSNYLIFWHMTSWKFFGKQKCEIYSGSLSPKHIFRQQIGKLIPKKNGNMVQSALKRYQNWEQSRDGWYTYLLGMFFIISVVRLSSPRNMRSISSSYCFLSALWEFASLLRWERFLTRSFGEPKEVGIDIIEFLPGNMWISCEERCRELVFMSEPFPPTREKMLREGTSIGCNWGLLGKQAKLGEPRWRLEVSGDCPENACLSQREGLTAGADPTWWRTGDVPLSIWGGVLGKPGICEKRWAWGPLINDGEFCHIMGLEGCCW